MAAATQDRDAQRQASELVNYSGASGYIYYKGALVMKDATGAIIRPVVTGAGASNATFLGVVSNRITLSGTGLGSSNLILDLWKSGEFTFAAQGTGASAHIGQRAYAIDDQTVGTSTGIPAVWVGEIVAIPTSTTYRVRIDNAVGLPMSSVTLGASWIAVQN